MPGAGYGHLAFGDPYPVGVACLRENLCYIDPGDLYIREFAGLHHRHVVAGLEIAGRLPGKFSAVQGVDRVVGRDRDLPARLEHDPEEVIGVAPAHNAAERAKRRFQSRHIDARRLSVVVGKFRAERVDPPSVLCCGIKEAPDRSYGNPAVALGHRNQFVARKTLVA